MPNILRVLVNVTALLPEPVLEKLQKLPVLVFELLLPGVGLPTQLAFDFGSLPVFAHVSVVWA